MNFTYEQLEPIIREKISNGGSVIIEPRGTSMLPLIRQGIDKVELSPPPEKLKLYDIPFYKRNDGHFVLHRIIKVRKNDYVLRGDNQAFDEIGVTDDMIIAVATAIIKNGKRIPTDDVKYLKYVKKQVLKKTMQKQYLKLANMCISIIKHKKNKAQK